MHFCDIFPILWYNFCSAKLLLIWLQGNEIMNLQPKILSNAFLINGYTPAVDMILVILCILLLLLLRETFIRRSRLFLLFRTCIALLLIAAFSNSCFYYTVLYFDSDTTLCILRTIYHSSLLLIFCLYAAYLKILIGIPGKTGHIMNIFLYSLYWKK